MTTTTTMTTTTMRITATTNDTESSVFLYLFLCRIEDQKLGNMQANSKNVAGITVSTTQCLYVVR